jgi:diguanylate cyclase (GGDEF)-like protein/PAS domain S-box-containing protein
MKSLDQLPDSSVELYRAFFDATSDAIVLTDENGQIVLANAACTSLLGWAPAQLQGMSVDSLVPRRFHQHAHHREQYTLDPKARPMGSSILVALHAEGHEIPVDIALTPLVVAGRRLVVSTIRDLRGRMHDGETLRVQATALRSAANGIVITDRSGTITWANSAACSLTGYTADELVGQHTRILKSGQHDQAFYAALWARITHGETWSGTMVNRRKDGSLYHEEQTIAPVVDEEGLVTHFIAIKLDVTEQRLAQLALARTHEELKERVREIEELSRRLHEQAIRDPLTGLYNRRYLDETLARDEALASRSNKPLAIVLLDIDHFKQVNDTWGHAAGDYVLQQLGEVLRANVRASDILCRIGGEEFMVVMPGATLDIGARRAEEWRRAFEIQSLAPDDGLSFTCTVSIGVAAGAGTTEATAATIRRADAALYVAKRDGRNRVARAEDTESS